MDRKRLIHTIEIALLSILTPVIYIGGYKILLKPIEIHVFEVIPTGLIFLVVLLVNIVWIIILVKWPFIKNTLIKILLTWLLLLSSAIFLSCLFVLHVLSSMR